MVKSTMVFSVWVCYLLYFSNPHAAGMHSAIVQSQSNKIDETTDWVVVVIAGKNEERIGAVPFSFVQGFKQEKLEFSLSSNLANVMRIDSRGDLFYKPKDEAVGTGTLTGSITIKYGKIFRTAGVSVYYTKPGQSGQFVFSYLSARIGREIKGINLLFQSADPTALSDANRRQAIDKALRKHEQFKKQWAKDYTAQCNSSTNDAIRDSFSQSYLVNLQHKIPLFPHSKFMHVSKIPKK